MRRLSETFSQRYEHIVLGAMLLIMHVAIWWDFGSALSRSLLLTHLGLFLLWQPIWQRDTRLSARSLALFLFLTMVFLITANWWLIAAWNVMLIGLVGGRTFTSSSQRNAYSLTLIFLVSELLIRCVPEIFVSSTIFKGILDLFQFGLFLPALIIMLIPVSSAKDRINYGVDLFRAISIALLTSMLATGSLLTMYHGNIEYPLALSQVLVLLSIFLFLISWLLSSQSGFSGLAQLWDRSLLNIGTPFEQWLTELASLAEKQQSPDEFLTSSIEYLVELPWVTGVRWNQEGKWLVHGHRSAFPIPIEHHNFKIEIFTARPASTILILHSNLLIELLHHFHVSKIREQELKTRTHMQAIHETGARVTHDIKNLLQSMQTLAQAMNSDKGKGEKGMALMRKQLPHITQRLHSSLEKLQTPSQQYSTREDINQWWHTLQQRYSDIGINFIGDIENNCQIPTELFNSAAENMLDNALQKQYKAITILVELVSNEHLLSIKFTDTGKPIDSTLAQQLFKSPVSSAQGLGVGLYQVAQQAKLSEYDIQLLENTDKGVSFLLSKRHD